MRKPHESHALKLDGDSLSGTFIIVISGIVARCFSTDENN